MMLGCRFVGVRQGWLALACAGALAGWLVLPGSVASRPAMAQETAEAPAAAPAADDNLLSLEELEPLVARVAYYPDEVLAVVLPASTFPVEIVQAARLLEQRKTQPDVKPGADWDPSVIALLNYPSVIDVMNKDLDWTTQLGEAVLNQQADVMNAIQQIRQTAYAAGKLESNDKVKVAQQEQENISIEPADPEKVYVPVYQTAPEPAPAPSSTTVVVQPAYYPPPAYYSDPYVPYYNSAASFWTGAFVGAATGVALGYALDWGNDDIDIDINNNNWDGWRPGRGDVDIGNVNIGNRVDVGNRTQIKRGESWRETRKGKASGREGAQARARKGGVQPTAGLESRAKGNRAGIAGATGAGRQKPAAAEGKRATKATGARTAQKGQTSAFSANQRGRDVQKAGNRGAQSRQPMTQSRAQNRPQTHSKAFGGVSNGSRTKQYSGRGASSRQTMRKR